MGQHLRRFQTADSARHRREHYAQEGEGDVNSHVTCEDDRQTSTGPAGGTLYRLMKLRKTQQWQGIRPDFAIPGLHHRSIP